MQNQQEAIQLKCNARKCHVCENGRMIRPKKRRSETGVTREKGARERMGRLRRGGHGVQLMQTPSASEQELMELHGM